MGRVNFSYLWAYNFSGEEGRTRDFSWHFERCESRAGQNSKSEKSPIIHALLFFSLSASRPFAPSVFFISHRRRFFSPFVSKLLHTLRANKFWVIFST